MNADPTGMLRAPSPVVREGLVEIGRSAPVTQEQLPESRRPLADIAARERPAVEVQEVPAPAPTPKRNSPPRVTIRRQGAWRRQTPRPSTAVATVSAPVMIAVPESTTFFRRTDVRVAIATAVAVASLMLGIWIGRHQSTPIGDPTPGQSLGAR